MAFVTSSDTISSMFSASADNPHSNATALACSRKHGTAVGNAPNSRWLINGHSAADRCIGPDTMASFGVTGLESFLTAERTVAAAHALVIAHLPKS
jgi:hypothetical protein